MLAKTAGTEQGTLNTAINSAYSSITSLEAFVRKGVEFDSEMPHLLFHFIVNEHFESVGCAFASAYVGQEVTKLILAARKNDVRLLICAAEGVNEFGALRGLLFEEVSHSELQRGGTFGFVRLAPTAPALPLTNSITIEKTLKVVTFRTAEEFGALAAPGVYARPVTKNYATVDAVLVPSDSTAPVMFLQMTVSTSHPIKAAALQKMRDCLPATLKSRPVQFVFVVPEDVTCGFKQQPFHTVQHTVMVNPPKDVPQYLLTLRLTMQQQQ